VRAVSAEPSVLCHRIGTERRARTTSVATAAAAQFESSGPLTVSQNVPPELRGEVPSTAGTWGLSQERRSGL
jgi:hypothetical protein